VRKGGRAAGRPSRAIQCREDGLGRAVRRARPAEVGEAAVERGLGPCDERGVVEEPGNFLRDALGGGVVLDQLGHGERSRAVVGHDVRHRDAVDASHEETREKMRQPVHAVEDRPSEGA
jgi:hypothetical protein